MNSNNSKSTSMGCADNGPEKRSSPAILSRNRKQAERCDTGLRYFALRVMKQVEEDRITTYNAVADKIVSEYANSHDKNLKMYDQKNIRRRVYDALNVLLAINAIQKTPDKRICWVGMPRVTPTVTEKTQLLEERARALQRVREKKAQLDDLLLQEICLKKLTEKNVAREEENGGKPASTSTVSLPFIMVNAEDRTVIDCSISNDRREYLFEFDGRYEIREDVEILKKMGLTMGLEKGECSLEDVEKAVASMPRAFEKHVRKLANTRPSTETEEAQVISGQEGQANEKREDQELLQKSK